MLLSELRFGSFLAYSPNGEDAKALESQGWMKRLKNDAIVPSGRSSTVRVIAARLAETLRDAPFSEILCDDAVLVPVPKSSLPHKDKHELWVPERLARALVDAGLGARVWEGLRRVAPVPRSSTSTKEHRPRPAQHFESLRVDRSARSLVANSRIVLVDDVVTRGSTLLGCASVLRAAFPNASIQGFAAMRAISNPNDFVAIRDPVVG